MSDEPVLIVGGGVVGLSIGWVVARAGRPVVLFERARVGSGASWLSAGMLAPDAEAGFEEQALYRLSRESLGRWPAFAAALEAASGLSVDYRTEGTLVVADDRDSAEALRRRYRFFREEGLDVAWLTASDALDREPFLSPRLAGALYAAGDHQVDSRRVLAALRVAFTRAGGVLHEQTPVAAVVPDAARPAVVTVEGARVEGRAVVLAAGAWSREIDGLAPDARPPVRPVKGQILRLRMEAPFALRHVVRGPQAYLAPKSDGSLVIGATMEEMGFDTRVTAGGVYRLLEGAWEVVPGIYDLEVEETAAGLRPGNRDPGPLVGAAAAPGIVFATGHFRHGILLAPVTAEEVGRLLLTGETSPHLAPFVPGRMRAASGGA